MVFLNTIVYIFPVFITKSSYNTVDAFGKKRFIFFLYNRRSIHFFVFLYLGFFYLFHYMNDEMNDDDEKEDRHG